MFLHMSVRPSSHGHVAMRVGPQQRQESMVAVMGQLRIALLADDVQQASASAVGHHTFAGRAGVFKATSATTTIGSHKEEQQDWDIRKLWKGIWV